MVETGLKFYIYFEGEVEFYLQMDETYRLQEYLTS